MPVVGGEPPKERRKDVTLEWGLTLTTLDDDRLLTLRVAQRLGKRLVYQTPRIPLSAHIGTKLRGPGEGTALTIRSERLVSALSIAVEGEDLLVWWSGAVYTGRAKDLADAIKPPSPLRPSTAGSDDPFWCFTKPPLEDEVALPIGDGVRLVIERRSPDVYARLDKGRDRGTSSRLTEMLDLGSPTTYTWVTTGGVAVRLVGDDRLRVFQRGHHVGHVSLALLQKTIVDAGGPACG